MNITIVGTGYVGLVSGAGLADFGMHVMCVDKDAERIDTLSKGGIPFYEPGLEELVSRNVKNGRLSFTTDLKMAVDRSLVLFIAVGTPRMKGADSLISLSRTQWPRSSRALLTIIR